MALLLCGRPDGACRTTGSAMKEHHARRGLRSSKRAVGIMHWARECPGPMGRLGAYYIRKVVWQSLQAPPTPAIPA